MTPLHEVPDALTPAECEDLIALCAAAPMKDAGLVRGTTAHQIRRAELSWLDDLPQTAWVMDRMMRLVAAANRESFGFDLTEFAESAQVARYGAEREGHFGWHSDIGAGALAQKRKLTVVVQLSDPTDYDGGVLEVWPDSSIRTAPRTRGSAVIFPSFTLHRVTPITRGTRWSLTLWSHGPAFR
jgi:PKHD-type hydroxylase